MTLSRAETYNAWRKHYLALAKGQAISEAARHSQSLEGRMRRLAARRDEDFHGFSRMRLVRAYGQALGVHRQLLWGLTRPSGGEYPLGRRGGLVSKMSL